MLSESDLAELECSLLPALERHHLRVLAHSLRCLQAAAAGADQADGAALLAWAQQQPGLMADPVFIPVLVEQLGKAAVQLEAVGDLLGRPALSLTMADLVAWGRSLADQRLADQRLAEPSEPAQDQAGPDLRPPRS